MPFTLEFGATDSVASSLSNALIVSGVPRFLWPKVTQWERVSGQSSWSKITNTFDTIFKSVYPGFRLTNTGNSQMIISGIDISALLCVPPAGISYPIYVPMQGRLERSFAVGGPKDTTLKLYLGSEEAPLGSIPIAKADADNQVRDYSVNQASYDDTLYYWKRRASDKNGDPNPDGTPIYQRIDFGDRRIVLDVGESLIFRLDLDCPEFTEGPSSVGGTGYANCYQGSVMQWYPVNSIKPVYEGGIEPEPDPPEPPEPGDIPDPSECFETSFVRLFETGGSVFEGEVNRFLYSDSEMSSSIYGPKKRDEYGGNRPWIKVKNATTKNKAIKDIYISVIQGTAYTTEDTVDYGIALYDLVFGSNPVKVYTPDPEVPYTGNLTLRLKGNLGCYGTVLVSMSSRSSLEESTSLDESYWKNRPSDSRGNWYPDTGSQAGVVYYHIELKKEVIVKPGDCVYFEVTCDWDIPLPSEPVPDFPLPTGWKSRWGYVFQWYTQNSCRVKMYDTEDPGPEPDPEPITSPYLSYEIGHGRQSWTAGLDRVLLNHGGSEPFWDSVDREKLPSIKFTNSTSRTVYVSYVNIKCVNGCTVSSSSGGSSGSRINFKGESGKGNLVGNYNAYLYGNVRPSTEGGAVEYSARATLICTNHNLVIPKDLQNFPEPDGAYWGPRPVDKEGNPNPDKVQFPGEDVPSVDLVFERAIMLKPGEVFFLDLSCVWWNSDDEGVRHCVQLFHAEKNKEESRIVTAPVAVQFTWNANGGLFTDSESVTYTYPRIGSIVLPNEYPVPVRENYLFLGWDKAIPTEPVDRNMSFKALWLKIEGGSFRVLSTVPGSSDRTWYQSMPWYQYNLPTGEWEEHTKAKKMVEGDWVDFPES